MNGTTTPAAPPSRGRRLARMGALAGATVALGAGALAMPAHADTAPVSHLDLAANVASAPAMVGGDVHVQASLTNVSDVAVDDGADFIVRLPWQVVRNSYRIASTTPGISCTPDDYGDALDCYAPFVAPGHSESVNIVMSLPAGSYPFDAFVWGSDEYNLTNNRRYGTAEVHRYPSATKAAAPVDGPVRAINIPVTVANGTQTIFGVPYTPPTITGTVTVAGPEGVFTAPVVNGVANVRYLASIRGQHTIKIAYSGSNVSDPSSTTVNFNVL
jgi:hypothetical protein